PAKRKENPGIGNRCGGRARLSTSWRHRNAIYRRAPKHVRHFGRGRRTYHSLRRHMNARGIGFERGADRFVGRRGWEVSRDHDTWGRVAENPLERTIVLEDFPG